MSTLTTAETALLTRVRAYNAGTTYTAATSSIDDWRVLDSGAELVAVIEMAGPTAESDGPSYGQYREVHQLGVWICKRRGTGDGGDVAAKAAVKTATEALKDYLRPYERLNNASGVSRAQITRTTAPSYISPSNDVTKATHVAQMITVQVTCRATSSPVETAGA